MHTTSQRIGPYQLSLLSLGLMVIYAFIVDTPLAIGKGLWCIFTCRALLMTDFIAVGGTGAALVHAAITGGGCLLLIWLCKAPVRGPYLAALWMSIGFSFLGQTVVGMAPIVFGVWLYNRLQKQPLRDSLLLALLSGALSPVVSECIWAGYFGHPAIGALAAILLGILLGFIFSPIAAAAARAHDGFDLYNAGFTGGLLATLVSSVFAGFGVPIATVSVLSEESRLEMAIILYLVFAVWALYGLLGRPLKETWQAFRSLLAQSGRLPTDYYQLFGQTTCLSMALLGILGTTVVLCLGAHLTAPALAGIFSMMGFAAFGKHLRNTVPIMVGAILVAFINPTPVHAPANIIAILLSTSLAPIPGQFGWIWGIIAGVLHLFLVGQIGIVAHGLNLYNNGFSAGIIALLLVPVIRLFQRQKKDVPAEK